MKVHPVAGGHPLTRASLLVRIRDLENQRAWEQFVEIYTPLVYGYCRNRGLQEADAEDVTQEVMRAVAAGIRRFEYNPERARFRHWLFTVARSKLQNFVAARAKQPQGTGDTTVQHFIEAQPAPEEQPNWDSAYDRRLLHWAAEQIRGEFKESTWQAFWQTAIDDCPARQVAERLGLSIGAVYIARSRVLARFKEKIESIADDEPGQTQVIPVQDRP